MLPCTYSSPLARVDNLDVISETRLNKGLQFCNQYDTLHMQRAGWFDVFYIVGSRKQVKGTFCTIGRREHINTLIKSYEKLIVSRYYCIQLMHR